MVFHHWTNRDLVAERHDHGLSCAATGAGPLGLSLIGVRWPTTVRAITVADLDTVTTFFVSLGLQAIRRWLSKVSSWTP